jgi:hypothetical protein
VTDGLRSIAAKRSSPALTGEGAGLGDPADLKIIS